MHFTKGKFCVRYVFDYNTIQCDIVTQGAIKGGNERSSGRAARDARAQCAAHGAVRDAHRAAQRTHEELPARS